MPPAFLAAGGGTPPPRSLPGELLGTALTGTCGPTLPRGPPPAGTLPQAAPPGAAPGPPPLPPAGLAGRVVRVGQSRPPPDSYLRSGGGGGTQSHLWWEGWTFSLVLGAGLRAAEGTSYRQPDSPGRRLQGFAVGGTFGPQLCPQRRQRLLLVGRRCVHGTQPRRRRGPHCILELEPLPTIVYLNLIRDSCYSRPS